MKLDAPDSFETRPAHERGWDHAGSVGFLGGTFGDVGVAGACCSLTTAAESCSARSDLSEGERGEWMWDKSDAGVAVVSMLLVLGVIEEVEGV